MASCSVVNVQCPNGRRQKLKLTAHMTLLQVVEEVCKKQGLNPNMYGLKHQRKTLDSSLTIRFANLPNNAHLELIESAEEHSVKKCVVALQLENGERLVHDFNSDNSLLNILMHWKSQCESLTFDENLAGVLCIYASQQIRGLEKLQTTTLAMIGLNGGRGVIRLIQPTVTKLDTSEVVAIPTENPEVLIPSPLVQKPSSEEMDLASCSTSSVSMISQVSEDDTMQCAETIDEPVINSDKQNQPSQSDAGPSQAKKKSGKNHDAMDVEVHTGVGKEEISSAVKVDNTSKADCHPPPVEAEASTSDGRTSGNAVQVQAFSGLGRTLSETGPDTKRPRFHSPPPLLNKVTEKSQHAESNENVCLPDREPVAFRLGESSSISSDDISDDFFEITVNDLRLMLKDLKSEKATEKPLMTTKMREEREKSKIDQYERVTIRVYFPDRTVLQGFFSPKETVSAVTSFVDENLQHRNTNFYLYTTPPRTILDKPSLTLFEARLFPAAIIHFGSRETQGCYLHSRLQQDMADYTSANERMDKYNRSSSSSSTHEIEKDAPSGSKNNVQTDLSQPEDKTSSVSVQQANESQENVRPPKTGKAVPKWFKVAERRWEMGRRK